MRHHTVEFSARTRVYDHADMVLFIADRDRASDLYESGAAEVMYGKRGHIRGLRRSGPDPALLPSCASRRTQPGFPHRHEAYDNVRGVWTIDRVPSSLAFIFQGVLLGCMARAA